ncbi:uncharacterized protein LOC117663696 [Pantherophis guttatus]|uniref:Uncharacterized protein LOC117663696 n=1 Tax=Pantherophis guttatus TaxID=94885 RepID=A0A6P9BQB5_PANGU|nr:uncharacterized protein LOC117663696 [Pantherophis guttatus]XP_034269959.1 uncharacterized protein LOC117663696 [Pantherophis guttatus]XP_034269960.1 uncharacterized protein LOC117663696 [Pantherophis guttatus]XP_034269961.1 uncharacterized protein LOC117663696 [Pantherophis guttatus]
MSRKNLADCDTESECDFYSDCWEQSVTYNKDLTDSSTENYFCFDSCSLFEKEKGEKKLHGIVLILENSQVDSTSFCKDNPLLQGEKVECTNKLQEELSLESLLFFKCKNYNTNGQSLKSFSSKIVPFIYSSSYGDHLCLNKAIPQLILTENSIEGQIIYTVKEACAFDKFHQKQSSDDNPLPSKQNKAVQVSSREIKIKDNICYKCFKQSPISTAINKDPKKPKNFHSFESHLVSSHSEYSSDSYQINNQIAEQICSHSSSEEPISLTLEATYVYPDGSLASNSELSDVSEDEDSQRHALAFQFKDSEHNQLFKKLHHFIVPQKQATHFKKQGELSQILIDEANYLLGTHSDPPESSASNEYSDQALPTSNLWSSYFSPFKYSQANQLPPFFLQSSPQNPVKSTFQKRKLKVSKPVKSVVFTKQKTLQRDQKYKSKPSIVSKFHSFKTLDFEPIDKNKRVKEQYVSLNQTSKCHCSPLLDLTVDLHSEDKNSEKFLTLHRSSHKQTRVGKVIHRFSSCYLLSPKNSFERLHYISPIRKKNHLKMQNIMNYFLGWTGRENRVEKYKEDISPTSKIRANETFISHMPIDKRSSTVPLHPHSNNYSVPFSTTLPFVDEMRHSQVPSLQTERRSPRALYIFPNECKHSYVPCVEMERNHWSPVESYGKYSTCHSPCCANSKTQQPPNKLNMCNNRSMEKLNFGTSQVADGGLVLKKFSVCSCGTMSQSGLFPNNDISESVRRKTRPTPDSNWKANKTASNRWNSTAGNFNTEKVCCGCHHVCPTCSSHNLCKHKETKNQTGPRNQVTEVASLFENGFPIRNLKEDVEKSETMKIGERKVKFHLGSDAFQDTDLLTTHISSPTNECHQIPKHFVSQPECSCCQTAVREHLSTSKVSNCLGSENHVPKNYLNRESIFLVDPNRQIKSQCKCSHEISLFKPKQTDVYSGNRPEISKRKDPKLTQESSKFNHGWKRPEQCKYCQEKNQYSHLQ